MAERARSNSLVTKIPKGKRKHNRSSRSNLAAVSQSVALNTLDMPKKFFRPVLKYGFDESPRPGKGQGTFFLPDTGVSTGYMSPEPLPKIITRNNLQLQFLSQSQAISRGIGGPASISVAVPARLKAPGETSSRSIALTTGSGDDAPVLNPQMYNAE